MEGRISRFRTKKHREYGGVDSGLEQGVQASDKLEGIGQIWEPLTGLLTAVMTYDWPPRVTEWAGVLRQ